MNSLQLTFCFDLDSLKPAELAELIQRSLGFAPTYIRSDQFCKNGGKFKPSHLEKLAALDELSSVELETDLRMRGDYFHFATLGGLGFQALYWHVAPSRAPSLEFLHALSQRPGFNAGYCSDAEYEFWQSIDSLTTYRMRGRSTENLHTISDPDTGELVVDLSRNPGRRRRFSGMWLQAAWRMWFGPGAFPALPPDRLLSFGECSRKEQLPAGTIFIELFEQVEQTETPENQRRQQAFSDWLGLDQLEKRAGEFGDKSDPGMDIKPGKFPHGGVWLLTQWFDEAGQLVRRSRATYRKSVELDARCRPIWHSGRLPPGPEQAL
ncbi:MAG TPA: hypothetical protein VEC99_02255 [Clostridia bacterium]|nr:hypothetical protein [Clostridia bacterium]